MPPLEKELSQTRHLLAVLLGRFPDDADELPVLDLDSLELPRELPLSLPSALARQRPDGRAAEAADAARKSLDLTKEQYRLGAVSYLTSSSTQAMSTIQANLRLNYDSNKALTDINTKVNAVLNQLPRESQQPVISVSIGEDIDSMYIGFSSKTLLANKITDYLIREAQPKLQIV